MSVELPERMRSGPSCDLMRRMPSTMSGPRLSNGPHSRLSGRWVATNFVAALRRSAEDGDFPYGDWTAPYRTPAGRDAMLAAHDLDNAVQRDVFDEFELSH